MAAGPASGAAPRIATSCRFRRLNDANLRPNSAWRRGSQHRAVSGGSMMQTSRVRSGGIVYQRGAPGTLDR